MRSDHKNFTAERYLGITIMGHERIGILPRSQRWQQVVSLIGGAAFSDHEMSQLAEKVLRNLRSRYENIHADNGVQRSFGFIIALTQAYELVEGKSQIVPVIDLSKNPSMIQTIKLMQQWVNEGIESSEYASLAKAACADTIAQWTTHANMQMSIFESEKSAIDIWEQASSGSGFCEVARVYFARFTERYLNYFLEREASAELPSVNSRNQFASGLHKHFDQVSHHAFETSKITQSFAAGWYNAHARRQLPSDSDVQRFLKKSFEKLREAILMELD